ncbi:P-loop NTPase fold protein [Myxococcus llanfairpwllgwyngyllgogerychwyrndrobwllllantysiliogogogochensis]|nr:P-loop NTPase fold protein [Myxococcus llanfairpwllgwyngyllgogerychwyrndrobwllllantysiliogogogochensis]
MSVLPGVDLNDPLPGRVFKLLAARRFGDPLLSEANRARALAAMLQHPDWGGLPSNLRLSDTTQAVLDAAREISGSPAVTPLHVLAGFLHVGARVRDTSASYIYHLADSLPGLERWMNVSGPRGEGGAVDLSHPTLVPLLRAARVYAQFTGTHPREVHARHLAGALLAPAPQGFSPLELELAGSMGSEKAASEVLHSLRQGLVMFLDGGEQRHDPPATWRIVFSLPRLLSLLPPEEPTTGASPSIHESPLPETQGPQAPTGAEGPAEHAAPPNDGAGLASSIGSDFLLEPVGGIRSDVVDGVDLADRLNIEPDVSALASIIAARSVEPPLAIGLFGDWGTGKSFFMSKMEKRLRMICAQEPPVQDAAGNLYYFRHIAQIRFNAWHYSDGNLWASLMARLFEGLSRYGMENGRADVEEKLRAQLRSAEVVLGDAQGRITVAQARRQQAEQHARDVHQRQRQLEATFLRGVGKGVLDKVKDQLSEQIAARWPEFGPKELLKWHDQLHQGWGRFTELWAWVRQGGRARAALLIFAALVTTVGPFALATLFGSEFWGKVVSAVGGLLTSLAGWSAFLLPKVNKVFAALDAARKDLDTIDATLVKDVQTKLGELEKEEASAQEVARKASVEVERLKTDLAKAHPTQRLRDFLSDRDQSGDYRQHLGLISLIRNDLSALSDLLGSARDTQSAGLPAVDRIVLYIDDLDRCPEERIVQVLEAVHLLLAFPLFVVVVGVDSRWLLHALKKRFEAFSSEDAATPQAYLEKIFQIPFTLHRMEADGFGQLIDFLLPTATKSQGTAPPAHVTPSTSPLAVSPEAPARPPVPPMQGPQRDVHPTAGGTSKQPAVVTPKPMLKLRPRLLQLSPTEVAVIKRMWRLIPTPRATNRLANCYRLLRVRLSESREAAFLGKAGPAEYPLVVTLLAMMIGFPEEFSHVLQRAKDPGLTQKNWGELRDLFASDTRLAQLARTLAQLDLEKSVDSLPIESIRYWLGVVCRFSFHLRDELPDTGKSATQVLADATATFARETPLPGQKGAPPTPPPRPTGTPHDEPKA